MPTLRSRTTLGAALAALLVWSCAHAPNPRLVQAEQELRAAETDPVVTEHAPLLLEDARRAVAHGRQAWRAGEDEDEVNHLAYLAARRVEIARVSAQRQADIDRAAALARRPEPPPAVIVTPPATLQSLPPRPSSIVEDIHFEPERATLPEDSRAELAHAADLISAHPGVTVRVEGHADDSERDALALSVERAQQVAQELVALGVDPDRLVIRGLGIDAAIASSATPSGRQRNRRVEIVLGPVLGAR